MKTNRQIGMKGWRLWRAAVAALAAFAAWGNVGAAPARADEPEAAEAEVHEYTEEEIRAWTGDRFIAQALMSQVRAGVPDVPMTMSADVQVLNRWGKRIENWRARVELQPDREGPGRRLSYRFGGGQGLPEGELQAWLPGNAGGEATFRWEGLPEGTEAPSADASIGTSELRWGELGFGYLWWDNPQVTGAETLRKRWACAIVEMSRNGGAERVRLWVAPSWGAVVQGEFWAGDKLERRFEVESVTRVRKVYMLSEMTVRNAETGARTRLKISDLALAAPDYYTEEEWEAFSEPVRW